MAFLRAPLHTMHLHSPLAMGRVKVGVQPQLQLKAFYSFLGNT